MFLFCTFTYIVLVYAQLDFFLRWWQKYRYRIWYYVSLYSENSLIITPCIYALTKYDFVVEAKRARIQKEKREKERKKDFFSHSQPISGTFFSSTEHDFISFHSSVR